MFSFVLLVHVLAGFAALGLFWIPVVTKKGGRWHRLSGWSYTWAMGTVAVTAVILALLRIFVEPGLTPDRFSFSVFLLFISVLAGATAYYGIRTLRIARTRERGVRWYDLGVSFLLLLSGVATVAFGAALKDPLITYFPIIGIVLGSTQLWFWWRPAGPWNKWVAEHLRGMLGCSIATITAFTVFGGPRLLGLEGGNLLLWFAPTLLLGPLIALYARRWSQA